MDKHSLHKHSTALESEQARDGICEANELASGNQTESHHCWPRVTRTNPERDNHTLRTMTGLGRPAIPQPSERLGYSISEVV